MDPRPSLTPPSPIIEWQDKPWVFGFILSVAINISIGLYFSMFAIIDFLITKCFKEDHRLVKAHRKTPNFMHCFYFDTVIYTFVVIDASILLFTSFPTSQPFRGDLPSEVVILLTVVCGIRIFLFCRDLTIFKNARSKIVTLLVHIVFIMVAGNAMITEKAGIMAFIIIISEGDVLVTNTNKLLRHLGYKHSTCYRASTWVGCYAVLAFRAIIPLTMLATSLVPGKPFDMRSPSSTVIFFVALIFYGVVNTWHVNSTVAKVCKRKARVIEVPYANFVQAVDETLKESEDEIPPSYQDACRPDIPAISGSANVATNGQEIDLESGASGNSTMESERQSGYRHFDMAGIILSENEDSYQHSAISNA